MLLGGNSGYNNHSTKMQPAAPMGIGGAGGGGVSNVNGSSCNNFGNDKMVHQEHHSTTIFEPWEDFWAEEPAHQMDDDDFDQDYIDIYLRKIGKTRYIQNCKINCRDVRAYDVNLNQTILHLCKSEKW